MKLSTLAANMTTLEIGPFTVLFSYETPVAYHENGAGYNVTTTKYSNTTSRHINKWLDGAPHADVPQSVIDTLCGRIVVDGDERTSVRPSHPELGD